jgi:hypothetical protein
MLKYILEKLVMKMRTQMICLRIGSDDGVFFLTCFFKFLFLICIVGGGIKVHLTLRPLNDLLYQPRVIMIMEKSVE